MCTKYEVLMLKNNSMNNDYKDFGLTLLQWLVPSTLSKFVLI